MTLFNNAVLTQSPDVHMLIVRVHVAIHKLSESKVFYQKVKKQKKPNGRIVLRISWAYGLHKLRQRATKFK